MYVGSGGRTNADGLRQLSDILGPLGATVIAVPGPLRKVLHLKSAVTALLDETVVGYPPLVDDPDFFPQFVAVPEQSGAHVVDLGGNKILMAADCPRSHELFTDRGYQVVSADISEFQKLEGTVTCLSVRLREAFEFTGLTVGSHSDVGSGHAAMQNRPSTRNEFVG